MSTGDSRRALGAAGERLAAAHLRALGFTLIEVNFRTRHGELDLVAADERHLVFCEVKSESPGVAATASTRSSPWTPGSGGGSG